MGRVHALGAGYHAMDRTRLADELPYDLTSIVSDNHTARRLLERGLPGLPRYLPVGEVIRTWAPRLVHVHLDDALSGIHEHRMFGEGELDLPETLAALAHVGFDGMAAVELSRHGHRGA